MKSIFSYMLIVLGFVFLSKAMTSDTWWLPYVGAGVFFAGLELFVSAHMQGVVDNLQRRLSELEERVEEKESEGSMEDEDYL